MRKIRLMVVGSLLVLTSTFVFGYSGGIGTEADPYLIATKADLLELGANTNDYDKCFKMTADIDLAGETFTQAVIASGRNVDYSFQGIAFTGVFDGNSNNILNLSIDGGSTNDYIGLFGKISSGEVKNLGIVDSNFTGNYNVGGLCGANDGTISSCFVTGEVTGLDGAGGICGENGGDISYCYSISLVSGGDYAGGLCGINKGDISSCYSTGSAYGVDYVGGFCAWNWSGSISNCYSTGSVNGDEIVGGFCGHNESGSISNCYSTGLVNGRTFVGGFSGGCSGTISFSFWDTDTSGLLTSDGGVGKTTTEMQTESTFTNAGWDFVDTWKMRKYPVFKWQYYNGGSGTEADPYLIATKADLLELGGNTNDYDKCFKMTADIDLAGETFTQAVIAAGMHVDHSFQGIAFTGVFDGNSNNVLNLSIDGGSTNDYIGLFGKISSGEVKNLGIVDSNVTGDYDVGGLCGANYGTISSCFVTGEVTGLDGAGGMCGENRGDISFCYSIGLVRGGNYAGGFCGFNMESSISNCYSTCLVTGKNYIGGFCGQHYSGTISSCYSTGAVNGNDDVGGFCGDNGGTISFCFWDTDTSGLLTSDGGVGKTTFQMQTESTFTNAGWDFIDTWKMREYPVLKWQYYNGGSGTEADPYLIATKADLLELGEKTADYDKHFKMIADIDLAGTNFTSAVIGSDTNRSIFSFQGVKFTGVFDGNSNNILNLSIGHIVSTNDYIGLFGYIDSGEVKNLGIVDSNVTGHYLVGGLCAQNYGTISSCFFTGEVTGDFLVGGLCGENNGMVSYCYLAGEVFGYVSVGGLCGLNNANISLCYSTCLVDGHESVGGFCGCNQAASISNCYSTGVVNGDAYETGGLCGSSSGGTISSSFWDVQTSGQSTSEGGGIGKTTAQMQTQSTFTDSGWDFVDTWVMDGYPVLRFFYIEKKTYQDWLTDFSVPANEQGITNAPAGDGIQNLLKYAIGLNPMEICSTSDLMEPVSDTNGVSIIYNKAKRTVDVELFPAWTDCLLTSDWNTDGFDCSLISQTESNETWKATHSITGECGYIRLKAQ